MKKIEKELNESEYDRFEIGDKIAYVDKLIYLCNKLTALSTFTNCDVNAILEKTGVEIDVQKQEVVKCNSIKLHEELCNLIDEVGEGFHCESYYAPPRYYSEICGVKNIRIDYDNKLSVKVLGKEGYLLPKKIEVRGVEYSVNFTESKNYGM